MATSCVIGGGGTGGGGGWGSLSHSSFFLWKPLAGHVRRAGQPWGPVSCAFCKDNMSLAPARNLCLDARRSLGKAVALSKARVLERVSFSESLTHRPDSSGGHWRRCQPHPTRWTLCDDSSEGGHSARGSHRHGHPAPAFSPDHANLLMKEKTPPNLSVEPQMPRS